MYKPKAQISEEREDRSNLQKGIDLQREIYKRANIENNYDIMAKAIENIKSEIRYKSISKGKKNQLKKISEIITWYQNLPQKYTKKTPSGSKVVFPEGIEIQINHNLQVAYEQIIELLGILDLI